MGCASELSHSMQKPLSLLGGLAFLVIGLVLVFTSEPFARSGPTFVPSPVPSRTAGIASSAASARAKPTIPDGYRVQIPRLAIDLPLAEGDVGRDIEQQK